jgi:transcriptional regulator
MHLDLLQGTLDMLILQTLSHGPRHGYGIATFIAESSKGTFRILDGALYASLHRLERSGLVMAVWGVSDRGRRARFYELTRDGRLAAHDERRRWHRYSNGVAGVLVGRPSNHATVDGNTPATAMVEESAALQTESPPRTN